MVHLEEDLSVSGMEFEGWQNNAQEAGGWFRPVAKRAEPFMWKWHDAERCKAAERHAKDTAAASTVGMPKRPGGGEGGGGGGRAGREGAVLPKRLKSWSGHHRPEACWPSNGRHKYRNAGPTSSHCCVLPPVPLMHLIPSMSPMLYLVSSKCLLVFSFSVSPLLASFSFLVFSFLVFSFLFFFFLFHFFFFLSYIFFYFLSLLLSSCFPIDLSLTCVCAVIGTT